MTFNNSWIFIVIKDELVFFRKSAAKKNQNVNLKIKTQTQTTDLEAEKRVVFLKFEIVMTA